MVKFIKWKVFKGRPGDQTVQQCDRLYLVIKLLLSKLSIRVSVHSEAALRRTCFNKTS
jgi:hypothetical protein